ncbi:MAG: FtsX-like permease family protein [Actinomycetia bacterium]|nr:FtsX-like permease family protein [Actinomycetes bacterium]
MRRLVLRNLWAYKRRLIGIMTGVVLGVSMLAGALTLSDTMRSSIDEFFEVNNAGVDAVVRNAERVSEQPGTRRGMIDAAVVDDVRATDGVAHAAPVVESYGQIVGSDGEAVGGNGPRVAGSWVADEQLNPWRIDAGRAPRAANEVVIDRASADAGDLTVGDSTSVLTPEPVPVTVVGIATFGASDTFGGTSYAAFTLEGAKQHLVDDPSQVSSVSVRAASGVGSEALAEQIGTALPDGVEVVTGADLTDENTEAVGESFLTIFQTAMTAFAAIALVVAAFSIHNTFSIVAAQRSRDHALLRAIGASRSQVIGASIFEALVIGVVGSAIGLVGGIGIALGLKGVFAGLGVSLPTIDLVVTSGSVVVAGLVGVVVAVLAGVVPAVRASRVPPVAALRDMATDRLHRSRTAVVIGVAALIASVALCVVGASQGSVALTALGAVALVVAAVLLGPVMAVPASRVLGAPAAALRGVTGVMSRENALRNPRRTSGSANALLIGVGAVALFSVFAASLQQSIEERVSDGFGGDLVVGQSSGPGGSSSLSPDVRNVVSGLDGVEVAAAFASGQAQVDGEEVTVGVADPGRLGEVLSLETEHGAIADIEGIAVSADAAADHDWGVGDGVRVQYPDGQRQSLTVDAIYDEASIVGDYLVPEARWGSHVPQNLDSAVYVALDGSASASDVESAMTEALVPYGEPSIQDRGEFIDAQSQGVGMLLNLVYVMLALAIIIATLGVANTLALSVHERVRELGLLRAVGQTRAQARAMVRWESVIVSTFGTIGGVVMGSALGIALAVTIPDVGTIAVPAVTLVVVIVFGAVAGVLASVRPARRAARTNLLRAIAVD